MLAWGAWVDVGRNFGLLVGVEVSLDAFSTTTKTQTRTHHQSHVLPSVGAEGGDVLTFVAAR